MAVADRIQTAADEIQTEAGEIQTEADEIQQTTFAFRKAWVLKLNSQREDILGCLGFALTDEVYPALRQHNVISPNEYDTLGSEKNPVLRAQQLFVFLERSGPEDVQLIIKILKKYRGHLTLANELEAMYNKVRNAYLQ